MNWEDLDQSREIFLGLLLQFLVISYIFFTPLSKVPLVVAEVSINNQLVKIF